MLLFGAAGLFGKFLALPALWIVYGRCGFAALALGAVLALRPGQFGRISAPEICFFSLLGVILAVHWATFFRAIQVSSVAIGSSAEHGSSIKITSGLTAMVRAMHSRCC